MSIQGSCRNQHLTAGIGVFPVSSLCVHYSPFIVWY